MKSFQNGTVLFEGDIVQNEKDGGIGEILFNDRYKGSQHQWFIKYEGDQHSSNLFNRVRYPGLRKIGNNFAEVYVEESQTQPHKAPWKDSEGNPLYAGDKIESQGVVGKIVYLKNALAPAACPWKIKYEGDDYFYPLYTKLFNSESAERIKAVKMSP